MKKLSVLIALALCLTIGGSYAAWSFAVGDVTDPNAMTASVNMQVQTEGVKGTLTATYAPEYYVEPFSVVDPSNATALNKYTPVLVDTAEDNAGDLKITFVASANANADVRANGISVTVTITSKNDASTPAETFGAYNTHTVLTINHSFTINAGAWETNDGNGTFTYTLSSAEIIDLMEFYADEQLDTNAKATAFQSAIAAGTITVTVAAN